MRPAEASAASGGEAGAGPPRPVPRRGTRNRAARHPRPSAHPRPRLALLPLAAVLVPLVMLAGGGWLTWRSVRGQAAAELTRSAEIGAAYAARALLGYAVAAARVNDRLLGLSDAEVRAGEARLHEDLQQVMQQLPQGELSYVIDRQGQPLLATSLLPVPQGTSLADRDYFQALRRPDPPEVHLSETFVGRFDGRLLFSLSRRRVGSGNRPPPADGFEGVVTVSVDPNLLAESLRRLATAPSDELALVRQDGWILSRTTGQDRPLPQLPPGRPFHAAVAGTIPPVFVGPPGVWVPPAALVALHHVAGFPAVALAIRPWPELVAEWWRRMGSHLVFGVPATLTLLLLSLKVRRDQRALDLANAALQRDVARSGSRLVRAQRIGQVGTFEFDPRTDTNIRSAEYMVVQGLAPRETAERHEDWVRRLHPDDRERAETCVLATLADPAATDYAQSYRIVTPTGEVRWIAARAEIERDAAGRAMMMRGAHIDVTPLRTTELALAESDARLRLAQEAVGIGTWEWTRATRTLTWSRKMAELWGFDPACGQPAAACVLARVLPEDRRRVLRMLALAQRSGQLGCEFRIRRPAAAGEDRIWVAARARLLPAPGAPHPRLMGVAYDVTERKLAEQRSLLLAHEVEHRAKNALTIVASLLRRTTADTPEEFAEVMGGRVRALAQTMGLLGQRHWRGAPLRELVAQALDPFAGAGAGPEISLAGPEVLVGVEAAQPLSMALHELATNAAKYGALSVPGAQLSVRWWVAGQSVHLAWQERGGPPLRGPPDRLNFGSSLIGLIFEVQLGGEVCRTWEPAGLVCEMRFPLTRG